MKIHQDEQGSEVWIKTRLGKLTASKAQAIASNGKGLDTLVFEKVAEILTGKPISTYTNEAMENGNLVEDEARDVYELQTGFKVEQVGFCEMSEYVGASPDGLVGDDCLVEIKCPTPKVFAQYLYTKKIDTKYYAQMQMQMFVTKRGYCDFATYHPDFPTPMIIQRVDRDEEFIKKLKVGLENGTEQIKEILKKLK